MYLLKIVDFMGSVETYVIRRSDNAQIPVSEDNGDYRAYLDWLAEGNTPEPWNPEA